MKAFAFQIQVFHVVHRRMTANERIRIFEQFINGIRTVAKGREFFEVLVLIRQHQALRTLSIRQMKSALRIDK